MKKALASVFLLATTTLGVLAACGGSDPTSPGPLDTTDASPDSPANPLVDGGPVSPNGAGAGYCDATIGVFIAGFGKCCSADDKQTQQYGVQLGLFMLAAKTCAPRLESGLASGRLTYDATAAQTCYPAYQQAVDSIPCGGNKPTVTPESLTTCGKVFTGRVAEGGACIGDHECVAGLTCVAYTSSSEGTCKRPPALGEACGEAQGDAGQLEINIQLLFGDHPKCAAGGYCFSHTCHAEAQPGGACSNDDMCPGTLKCRQAVCSDAPVQDLGGPCRSQTDCKTPLFCEQPSFGAAGTCQPKKAAGEACGTFELCKGRCDRFEGGSTGVCKAYCGSE